MRIAEFALIAAPFERRALTVQGVECELLIHPMHMRNVELFAASGDGLVDRLRDRLQLWLSGRHAPAYPHDVISLVEVPAQLRRFGGAGSWLPCKRFQACSSWPNTASLRRASRSAGVRRRLATNNGRTTSLRRSTITGAYGIALTAGAARNLVLSSLGQRRGRCRGRLLGGMADCLALARRPQRRPGALACASASSRSSRYWYAPSSGRWVPSSMASRWFGFFSMALEDKSEKLSFTGFDPASTEDGTNILIHKGNLIALSLQRLLGYGKVTQSLRCCASGTGGGTFTSDDFVQAMIDVDPTVAPFLEHVMGEQALPGFLAQTPTWFDCRTTRQARRAIRFACNVAQRRAGAGIAGVSYRTVGRELFPVESVRAHTPQARCGSGRGSAANRRRGSALGDLSLAEPPHHAPAPGRPCTPRPSWMSRRSSARARAIGMAPDLAS